jgi:hypothetical protein
MEWGKAFPGATDEQILDCITRAAFYRVGMCKITYGQTTKPILEYLSRRNARILHLTRTNYLRVVVSQMITGMVVGQALPGHTAHTFSPIEPPQVSLSPGKIVYKMRELKKSIEAMRKQFTDYNLEVLELVYADLVGHEGRESPGVAEAEQILICDFLGVRQMPLCSDLRRVNKGPLSSILENWDAVSNQVAKSEFADCLKEESVWT